MKPLFFVMHKDCKYVFHEGGQGTCLAPDLNKNPDTGVRPYRNELGTFRWRWSEYHNDVLIDSAKLVASRIEEKEFDEAIRLAYQQYLATLVVE